MRAGDLGVDVNADRDAFGKSQMDSKGLLAFSQSNTVYPLPLFNAPAGDYARYWDSMVEQYQSAQTDFAAVWLKGNNQPATFANWVTAIGKHGMPRRIKVMPFDDNPASWTAMWNYDHGHGYNYTVPFDMGVPANWAWVWDKNLKVFFQSVPNANRYKIGAVRSTVSGRERPHFSPSSTAAAPSGSLICAPSASAHLGSTPLSWCRKTG